MKSNIIKSVRMRTQFAYVGSHKVLSSNTSHLDLAGDEVGTLHTSAHNIQKLINCFERQPNLSTHSLPKHKRPVV